MTEVEEVRVFRSITATPSEVARRCHGDHIVAAPDVVMDRAFTVSATPAAVWPWLQQLGKHRAGWYLPRSVERVVPRSHRALRRIDDRWQHLRVGTVIPDYGGREATFEVAVVDPPGVLVHRSRRGRMELSWSITLTAVPTGTRVHLRLVLGPVRRRWLASGIGGLFDALTVLGMAAGLRERLADSGPSPGAAAERPVDA